MPIFKSISRKKLTLGLSTFFIVIVSISILIYIMTPKTAVSHSGDQEINATATTQAYALKVNGSVVTVLPTQDDVDKMLQTYKEHWAKPSEQNKIASVDFAETVAIENVEVPQSEIQSPDQAIQSLLDGKVTTTEYTVQKDDSWWLIARKNNMLIKDVLASNPGTTEDTLIKPGQVIKLVDVTPYLTVISKGTYTEVQTISYDTITKVDTSLKSGQTRVKTEGSEGSKLVTYSYEQSNGKDIKKEVVDEKIIKAPVTKLIAKGPSQSKTANKTVALSRGSDPSTIVKNGLSLVGTPYIFGGTTRNGFDCSGFTQYVYKASGISLPRTSFAQFDSGVAVSRKNLTPGDLVFFTTYTKGASHVGIYIGGGSFVHADNPRRGVHTSSLNESYYSSRYLGARRY